MAVQNRESKLTRDNRRKYLCTQRRLAVDNRFHRFTLRFNGNTDADQAAKFFAQCPELNCMIQSDFKCCWIVYLSRK